MTLALTVSADGRTAALQVQPVSRTDKKIRILVHPASLEHAGFVLPAAAKDGSIELPPGQPYELKLTRRP